MDPEKAVYDAYHAYLHDIEAKLGDRVPEMLALFKSGQREEIAKRGQRYVNTCSTGMIYAWDDKLVLYSYFRPVPTPGWIIQQLDLPDTEANRAAIFAIQPNE